MALPKQDEMLALLSQLSDEELHEMFEAQDQLEKRLAEFGPQDDEELHTWIAHNLGVVIPRVAVCEGHQAPFEAIADLFFERVEAVLIMANRGGAKTHNIAVLHWLNSKFKPGTESATFGAIESQSFRAYAHLRDWIFDKDGNKKPEVVSSLMRETVFKNGSKIEVLGSTPEAVNGPHPQKVHGDELELMRDDTYQESRNMSVSKKLDDGRLIKPQDILTSTRKGPTGRMQRLIDEIEKAEKEGFKPPRKLYSYCIKETAAQVENCQIARPELAECDRCECDKIRKGEWENGTPRLLKDVCGGDFYKSRGWQPYGDIVKHFTENDRNTFEVQQLCTKPEMAFHYLPDFSEQKHCIRNYKPDPENGPIFTSVDWGGSNPHSVNWYQLLNYEVEVDSWVQPDDPTKRYVTKIPEGALVCFDELYIAEVGNEKLGQMVKQKEHEWAKKFGGHFPVYERYADPQGKSARLDWKSMGLRTVNHATREFEEHIKDVRNLFDDNLFFVDGERCKMWVREAKEWRRDPKTLKQIDTFNHAMSNFRYCVANIKKIRKKAQRGGTALPTAVPINRAAGTTVVTTRSNPGPIRFRGKDDDQFSAWRKSLGEPVTKVQP